MPLSKAKEKTGSQDTAAEPNESSLPNHTEEATQPVPGDHVLDQLLQIYLLSFINSYVTMQPFL